MNFLLNLKSAGRVVAISLAAFGVLHSDAHAAEPRKPNIVFLLADDLGYGDVGAFGQDKIHTPTIDRLAAEGIKLTTHYAGNAVCAPSRCVLLSGLHPGHAAVRDNKHPDDYALGEHEGQIPIPPGYLRFPLTLKKLGYTTGAFGKWSLGSVASTGNPLKQGIDHFYGYECQSVAHNYYPKYLWEDGKQVFLDNPDFPSRGNEGVDQTSPAAYTIQGKQYSADLIGEKALQFVRDNKDHPFVLYYLTTLPHSMLQVPEDSLKEYEGKFPEDPSAGGTFGGGVKNPRAVYAAMVTRMDREFGKVVTLIQDLGLDNDTIFVFTSDNGAVPTNACAFFKSGGNFRGFKGTMYEGGTREPAIVRWKGHIAPGASNDRVTGFEDWFPTVLELAGASELIPTDIDGISFAPTLLGKSQQPRPFLYREMPAGGGEQFVRVGNWKAIRNHISAGSDGRARATNGPVRGGRQRSLPGAPEPDKQSVPGAIELFDLEKDPSEQNNVAAEHPDVIEKLSVLLQSQHTSNDIFPISGIDNPGATH